MKTTTPLLALYDIWCLFAIGLLPAIFLGKSFTIQFVNYLLILLLTFFWLRHFIGDNRQATRMHLVSWGLRWFTLGLTCVLFMISAIANYL
ncbi:hypothetical protein [Levilactobacillus cerevisiae]|uniref:hypothetical protein n=1 Tax=Levilactobacillus cerevisiae TaxID=1704076 RepID=UPI000F785B7B|nr:hypothetical protein [Levilactobacillus cerevisiae]